jgi:putative nucleotidyltransferase with HDIG domain
MLPKIEIPPLVTKIFQPYETYLVGGSVRDAFLSESPLNDIDIVIFGIADLESLAKNIADEFSFSFVLLDEETKAYRLVNKDFQIDLLAPRAETIQEDLLKRDFTVNSMALSLKDNQFIDPSNGLEDLRKGLIRAVSKQNLIDDPLRCLRGFRFQAYLSELTSREFSFDQQTLKWVREVQDGILKCSVERISAEIWKILTFEKSFKTLWNMIEVGIWEKIFPEFQDLRKVPSNDFHHLPLLEHTFELVKQYENEVKLSLPVEATKYIKHNSINSIPMEAIVKMGCLLHDISKPETWNILELPDGSMKHTFWEHDTKGAELSKKIGERMKWPRAVNNAVADLVKFHLRPFQLSPIGAEPTEKTEGRFFRKTENIFLPLIAVCWADMLSTRGPMITDEIIGNNAKRLQKLCKNFVVYSQDEKHTPLLLQGDLLKQAINEAKLPPSKQIKIILEELRERQLAREIILEEDAYQWFVKEGYKINEKCSSEKSS